MEVTIAYRLAERFSILSPEQRRLFLVKMYAEGVNPAQLPILQCSQTALEPLSYAQQRQWFLWRLDPGSTAYHIAGALRLDGTLDIEALRSSFDHIVARHETLRTVFRVGADGLGEQVVEPAQALDIPVVDLREIPAGQREARAMEEAQRVNASPFDLTCGPLVRIKLLCTAEDQHILVVVMHHIVSDGWSMQIIVNEFVSLYRARIQGQEPRLPALPIQYTDYAVWQRNWLEAGEKERQLAYWQQQLGTEHPILALPTDHPRQSLANYHAARHTFELPSELAALLKQTAQAKSATLFMVLLAGFQVLLHRHTGQNDIRVGVPIANRNRVETEGVVGFFVNTQVLRNELHSRMPLGTVLEQATQAALDAQSHQDLPFEQLVEALHPERSLSHSPLFQVMHNHQHDDGRSLEQLPGLSLSSYALGEQGAQFELTLDTQEHPSGQVSACFTYAVELFEAGTIVQLGAHYLRLLQGFARHPEKAVGEIDLLDEAEHARLRSWGRNEQRYADAEPVHRLIERQVEQRPDAVALIFGDSELSYRELNRRANRLAHRLMAQGVGPDVRVGIAIERSIEMIVGLLGILKAGGAYVPLDPAYPAERLEYMVRDSGIGLLLTQKGVRERIPQPEGLAVMEVEEAGAGAGEDGGAEHNPQVILHGEHLAYVIYTSGSTGKPKGVGNRHCSLYNRLTWMQHAYGLAYDDCVLQKTPFSFDVSVWEFFWPLMTGARLAVAAPGDHRDPARIVALIRRHQVTTLHFVPSMLQSFIAHEGVEACAGLSRIICSGEALLPEMQARVFEKLPGISLYNLYGPTEAAIDVTHWKCIDEGNAAIPIGRPIANIRTCILDAELNLVPMGVAGELYLGGTGLARGYLNRAGLTAERFVADPFDGQGGRLYRTGDLVRWRTDGQIEYIGRLDHQVKIRGFRIELGEIEAQLLLQDGVREAVVMTQEGPAGTRLVGYVSAEAGQVLEGSALKARLLEVLPDYMVPAALVVLEALPLNPNGKIDRKALPDPDWSGKEDYEAPQGEAEEALAMIWAEVLGVERVGRQDNFFELGGDSILSLQIVARLRRAGWKITPKQLFERQTVMSLAGVTERLHGIVKTGQAAASGDVPLLPIQAEFFQSEIPARHHWNQAILLQSSRALNTAQLARALAAVVRHHDALRMRYASGPDGRWLQAYGEHDGEDLLWTRRAGTLVEIETLCDAAQRSLDLKQGPLMRAVAIEVSEGNWRLLLAVHHLVIDGVSWRVLLEDLQTAYTQLNADQAVVLPVKTSPYQAWAQRLQGYTKAHDDEFAYWQGLAGVPAALPFDWPEGANTSRHHASITLSLDRASTEALLKDAPAAYRTQVNDLLLTSLGRALCRWSGHERIMIDLEGHGREDLYEDIDLSRTVGWFTSICPVILDPLGDPGDALKRVKEGLRQIPRKGIGYGAFKYLGTPEQRQVLASLPQARIIFNYLGQLDQSFDKDALWTLAEESAGAFMDEDAPRGHALSISGQIYDGELRLAISYSDACHRPATIEGLAEAYKGELQDLIAHCVSGAMGVTPSDFPWAGLTQAQLDGLPLTPAQFEDIYPLSPMQAGMLFHSLYEPDGNAYLNQLRVDIDGLDLPRFHAAWRAVQARHDILRTGFLHQRETLLQWVAREVTLPFVEYDWRDRTSQDAALAELARADLAQGFDLAQPPLQRLHLIRTDSDRYHLIWTVHHVLLDGWSTSQLLGEVLRHYSGEALSPHGGRYRDYIVWLQSRDAQASEVYWREQLQKLETPTRLVAALPKSGSGTGYGEHVTVLDSAVMQGLAEFAKRERITLNTLVQAAWGLLLQRYTGQTTVTFGATVAGRPGDLPGAEQLLGLFINTLPVITDVRPEQAVGDWLRELQAQNLASREHEHTPLYEIQRWAGQSGQGLFDSILVFENYPVDAALQAAAPGGLHFSEVKNQEETNYAMTIGVVLAGEQRYAVLGSELSLTLRYSYARESFSEATVSHISVHLGALLHALARHPEKAVGEIDLLDEAEHARLRSWGRNEQRYADAEPVHRLIERQVEQRPDAVALIFGDSELSYRELNRRANRLAHRLMAQGVGPDVRVGIAIERSIEMIVGLLGILKAGGAYVPLDPAYPAERLEYMVRDSGIGLLLTQKGVRERIPQPEGLAVMEVEEAGAGAGEDGGAEHNPQVILHGEHLAYVIYTSGSTGKPKGVAVAHASLSMHVQAIGDLYGMTPEDKELQFASINFDGAHERWLVPLVFGSGLMPRDNELWDIERTYAEIVKHHITIACFTPGYLHQLAETMGDAGRDSPIRSYTVGGEAMSRTSFDMVQKVLRPPRIINGYGPTETVITPLISCFYPEEDFESTYMPIGRVVGDRTAYILDSQLKQVPTGVAGELYLGGIGLARCYLNRAGLTAERFVADPFDGEGGRLYRTGDLVRWRADGQIEYLGRLDHQVKIRGFRIELGEIEAQVLLQAGVREAVVVTQEGPGGTRLVGYVSAEAGQVLEGGALRAGLLEVLPDYMVPAALVVLEALPLNPNGKIDRKALPDPDWSGKEEYEAPQGEVEEALAAIWAEVLGVERVGRQDNFFELGGHSLIVLKAQLKIQQHWSVPLPTKTFFEYPLFSGIANVIQLKMNAEKKEDVLETQQMSVLLDALEI